MDDNNWCDWARLKRWWCSVETRRMLAKKCCQVHCVLFFQHILDHIRHAFHLASNTMLQFKLPSGMIDGSTCLMNSCSDIGILTRTKTKWCSSFASFCFHFFQDVHQSHSNELKCWLLLSECSTSILNHGCKIDAVTRDSERWFDDCWQQWHSISPVKLHHAHALSLKFVMVGWFL